MLNKKSVDDINVKGKKVLVRCDFNVPLQDGKITLENRKESRNRNYLLHRLQNVFPNY